MNFSKIQSQPSLNIGLFIKSNSVYAAARAVTFFKKFKPL